MEPKDSIKALDPVWRILNAGWWGESCDNLWYWAETGGGRVRTRPFPILPVVTRTPSLRQGLDVDLVLQRNRPLLPSRPSFLQSRLGAVRLSLVKVLGGTRRATEHGIGYVFMYSQMSQVVPCAPRNF